MEEYCRINTLFEIIQCELTCTVLNAKQFTLVDYENLFLQLTSMNGIYAFQPSEGTQPEYAHVGGLCGQSYLALLYVIRFHVTPHEEEHWAPDFSSRNPAHGRSWYVFIH